MSTIAASKVAADITDTGPKAASIAEEVIIAAETAAMEEAGNIAIEVEEHNIAAAAIMEQIIAAEVEEEKLFLAIILVTHMFQSHKENSQPGIDYFRSLLS